VKTLLVKGFKPIAGFQSLFSPYIRMLLLNNEIVRKTKFRVPKGLRAPGLLPKKYSAPGLQDIKSGGSRAPSLYSRVHLAIIIIFVQTSSNERIQAPVLYSKYLKAPGFLHPLPLRTGPSNACLKARAIVYLKRIVNGNLANQVRVFARRIVHFNFGYLQIRSHSCLEIVKFHLQDVIRSYCPSQVARLVKSSSVCRRLYTTPWICVIYHAL